MRQCPCEPYACVVPVEHNSIDVHLQLEILEELPQKILFPPSLLLDLVFSPFQFSFRFELFNVLFPPVYCARDLQVSQCVRGAPHQLFYCDCLLHPVEPTIERRVHSTECDSFRDALA